MTVRGGAGAVEQAVASMPAGRWLLAISGGRDSMALLHAMAGARRAEIAAVANFDHGTGAAARQAAALVERAAMVHEVPSVSGTATAAAAAATEAEWRAARWGFLQLWAEELNATVVTAHTRDDQIETVVLRLLRDSGVRGLAGMRAPEVCVAASADEPSLRRRVARPLLTVSRAALAAYAETQRVTWVEDPSNASRAHARNRVRLDLLPALERAQPGFSEWCWQLGERAAAWRAEVDAYVERTLTPARTPQDGAVVVRHARVAELRAAEWSVLWPALAGRAGLAMDRRGLERAAAWAPRAKAGSEIPLAGGARITRTGATYVIHPAAPAAPSDTASDAALGTLQGSRDYILHA